MMLSISIVAVAITLTLLQFRKQSQLRWQVAQLLSFLLFALSAWNVYDQNSDREFYIRSLEKIGTRVQWRETEVSVELINDAETVVPARAGLYLILCKRTIGGKLPTCLETQ